MRHCISHKTQSPTVLLCDTHTYLIPNQQSSFSSPNHTMPPIVKLSHFECSSLSHSSLGNNSISNCDFQTRGEYMGALDGCAIDFETAATDFRVINNTFSGTYGAGVMVFGHGTTSRNLTLAGNAFLSTGCLQPHSDQGGIALICPEDAQPTGLVANNSFITCPGVPAIARRVPSCGQNMTFVGNRIDVGVAAVAKPRFELQAPSPQSTAPSALVPLFASTTTPNATLRYTLDGSRPTEHSPVVPVGGVVLPWPGPSVAVNVRGFAPGLLPSVTEGTVLERRLYIPQTRRTPQINSVFEVLKLTPATEGEGAGRGTNASARVWGWAVDLLLPGGGLAPVHVQVAVDFSVVVANASAAQPRPDLVRAHVAPNADHGFDITLPPAVAAALGAGRHVVEVAVVGGPSCPDVPCQLMSSPHCVVDGTVAPC